MDVQVANNTERSRYEVRVDGEPGGFAQYRLRGDRIEMLHTEIDDRFEGQGVGSVLIRHALDEAGCRGLGVLPTCSFVRGYIARHPDEYLAVVPAEQRPRFDLPA